MSFDAEILADSPVGFWKLDETSGTTAVDSSGNGRDGTYSSGAMVGVGGAPCSMSGVSPLFGAGSYVEVPSNAAWTLTSTITIECLFRMASTPSPVGALVSHDPFVAGSLGDAAADGHYNVYALTPGSGVEVEANNGFPFLDAMLGCTFVGDWAHLMVVKNGGTTIVYLQGVVAGSAAVPDFSAADEHLLIGRRGYNLNPFAFDGNISRVAIYSTALSPTRVAAHRAQLACPQLCPGGWRLGLRLST